MDVSTLIQVILGGLATGSTYALVGLGIVLILNGTSVANFAHGEVGLFGAYVSLAAMAALGGGTFLVHLAGLMVATTTAALCGALIGWICLYRSSERSLLASAVLTIGLFFSLHALVLLIWGPEVSPYPSLFGQGVVKSGGAVISVQALGIVCVAMVILAALVGWLRFTRMGVVSRAIVQNELGATLTGLPTARVKVLMWTIGSGLSGLAAALIASTSYLGPETMLNVLIFAFAGATLGGLTSLMGTFVGGIALGVLQNLTSVYISGSLADVLGLGVIVIVLVVRPAGLFGEIYVEKV